VIEVNFGVSVGDRVDVRVAVGVFVGGFGVRVFVNVGGVPLRGVKVRLGVSDLVGVNEPLVVLVGVNVVVAGSGI